jgi:broad specificity phosphatase PhoE
MCHSFTTVDGCPYGAQCRRVHDIRFRPGSALNTPTLCAQWRGGDCAVACDRGTACHFVHDARGTAAEGNPGAASAALALCRNQKSHEGCLRAERCPFLHDVRHERMRAPQNEAATCRNFATVYGCRRGGWCRFLHDTRVVVEECSRFALGRCTDDACGFIHDERRQPAEAAASGPSTTATSPAAVAAGGCDTSTPTAAMEPTRRVSAPVTVVTIVRHGERVDAVTGAPNDPSGDPPLTPDGMSAAEAAAAEIIAEARALAETLEVGAGSRPVRIELSVSPFRRCLQTAEGILAGLSLLKDVSVATVSVEAQLGEVFCADVIKGLAPHLLQSGPLLRNANWVEFTGINGIPPPSYVGPPITFGEPRTMAHTRFRRAVGHYASAPASSWDRPFLSLRLLVTHGDALQAIGEMLRPAQVVYAAEYLGRIHVAQVSSQPMASRDFTASKMVLVQSFDE